MLKQYWKKSGQILSPKQYKKKCTHIGSTFLNLSKNEELLDLYFTHRNKNNISEISKCKLNIKSKKIIKNSFFNLLKKGSYGFFDQDGVSYPSLVKFKKKLHMFYVGWNSGYKNLPFKNNIGLARLLGGRFKRVSVAPIIPLDKTDPISIGSSFVKKIKNKYIIWYTSFLDWKKVNNSYKHFYTIKTAKSSDLINWKKNKTICIKLKSNDYAISKPSIIKYQNNYHMWFCFRGKKYQIGYAYSKDGLKWIRKDNMVKIENKNYTWENNEMSYPSVIKYKKSLYMVYCGRDYGKGGIGLMEMKLK